MSANFGGNGQKYPEYVQAAVNWWANAIMSPNFDNGESLPSFLSMMMASSAQEYSQDDIKVFKEAIARGFLNEISERGHCTIDVDYHPCKILADAGDCIGVSRFDYPCKTIMNIE